MFDFFVKGALTFFARVIDFFVKGYDFFVKGYDKIIKGINASNFLPAAFKFKANISR